MSTKGKQSQAGSKNNPSETVNSPTKKDKFENKKDNTGGIASTYAIKKQKQKQEAEQKRRQAMEKSAAQEEQRRNKCRNNYKMEEAGSIKKIGKTQKEQLNSPLQIQPTSQTSNKSPYSNYSYGLYQQKYAYSHNPNYPDGLPNVGNTCFLNSIIQFLFGAPSFRQVLINIGEAGNNRRYGDCASIIGNIFASLKEKRRTESKAELLRSLLPVLEKINNVYQRFRQEDALETLLNIINYVDDTYPHCKILEIFNVESTLRCYCKGSKQYITSSLYSSLESQTCGKCHSQFKREIINSPECIIFSSNGKALEKTKLINCHTYELVSQIVYSGSGHVGHYTCLREENGVIYEFDDTYVSRYEPKQSYGYSYSSSYGQKAQLLLYVKKGSKGTASKIKVTESMIKQNKGDENERKDRKHEQQYEKKESTSQGNNIKKQFFTKNIYLNQIYKAEIQAPCKIILPDKKLGYKARPLYFQLKGNSVSYEVVIENAGNYFYYEPNKRDLDYSIRSFISTNSSIVSLSRIIEKIEERLILYFKLEVNKAKTRQEEGKLVLKDRESAAKDYGHLDYEAEKTVFASLVK